MIPYTTVRDHLDVEHWVNTTGLSWLQLVGVHEDEHRSEQTHRHGVAGVMVHSEPAAQLELRGVVEDVPTGGVL